LGFLAMAQMPPTKSGVASRTIFCMAARKNGV
jgi:hypothetical protein